MWPSSKTLPKGLGIWVSCQRMTLSSLLSQWSCSAKRVFLCAALLRNLPLVTDRFHRGLRQRFQRRAPQSQRQTLPLLQMQNRWRTAGKSPNLRGELRADKRQTTRSLRNLLTALALWSRRRTHSWRQLRSRRSWSKTMAPQWSREARKNRSTSRRNGRSRSKSRNKTRGSRSRSRKRSAQMTAILVVPGNTRALGLTALHQTKRRTTGVKMAKKLVSGSLETTCTVSV
mmetsp:Transcript_29747/g.79030  ORF Transcript_29747/g.79030 Transcript_29747/m.79030 type:complete len:229 (-) Transcript_29747:936-1622(-)